MFQESLILFIQIPLVNEYYASPDKIAHELNYSLQDRFAQVFFCLFRFT